MRVPALSRLQLALAAGAVGIACGAAAQRQLPPAGSDRDDGTGLLAAASSQLSTPGRGYGGAVYGGASYNRPSRYGGGRYADYQFQPGARRHRGYPSTYLPRYSVDHTRPTGRVVGVIAWATRPIATPPKGCPAPPATPDWAIVSIADARRGRGFPDARLRDQGRYQLGGVVELGRCGFEPRVQAVGPIGLLGTAVQRRPGGAEIIATRLGSSEVAFEIEMRSRGERRGFELSEAGVFELSAQSGERGWIAVIGHPLFSAVDPGGSFVIDDVPVGEHTLAVWHPPVVGGTPIEVTRDVVVRAKKTTRVSIALGAQTSSPHSSR